MLVHTPFSSQFMILPQIIVKLRHHHHPQPFCTPVTAVTYLELQVEEVSGIISLGRANLTENP